MKQLFIRLGCFFASFILTSLIVGAILPEEKYWGNEKYESKIKEFKGDKYNAVFFGSSRILTGINPNYFDSVMFESTGIKIRSFNLATAGSWSNETIYLFEQFLEDTLLSRNTDIVFMEFQNIMAIQLDRLSTSKVIYYQNLDNLSFVSDFGKDEVKSDVSKIPLALSMIGLYGLATLEENLNVGKSKLLFGRNDNLTKEETDARGFMKLDQKLSNRQIEATVNGYVSNIKTNLWTPASKTNDAFLFKLNDLIRRSEAKGIKLIYILPPVRLTKTMAATFHALPEKNKIQLCDVEKFPALYKPINWADKTHLNYRGSRFLNNYLAQEIAGCKCLTISN